jgi:hypothetical protein
VFEVNIPVGIIAVAVVLAGLPYVKSKASWRDIDFWGAATLAAGVVPMLIALTITRDHAWTSPQVMGLLALATVMLVAFIAIERRVEHPIVPLQLFKNPTFSVSMLVGFLTAFGMFGSILFTPLVFQGVLGISATNSGALITPMMFGLIAASTLTGFLMRRIKYYRYLGTVGVAVMIFGMWLLSQITPSSTEWHVVADLIVVGLGIGTTFPLYLTAVQTALPRQYLGVASSQIQFWRNLGGTVGSAILGAVLAIACPTTSRPGSPTSICRRRWPTTCPRVAARTRSSTRRCWPSSRPPSSKPSVWPYRTPCTTFTSSRGWSWWSHLSRPSSSRRCR